MAAKSKKSTKRIPRKIVQPQGIYAAAARLVQMRFVKVQQAVQASRPAASPEAMHDIRVELRRIRFILKWLRFPLGKTTAPGAIKALTAVLKVLGPLRDLDVWMELLADKSLLKGLPRVSELTTYMKKQGPHLAASRREFIRLRSSPEFRSMMRKIAALSGKELPALAGTHQDGSFTALAGRDLKKIIRKIQKTRAPREEGKGPDIMHETRKQFRKYRYLAEAVIAGSDISAENFLSRLKAVTSTLGHVHDMDMALERLKWSESGPPQGLADVIIYRRRQSKLAFLKAWEKLTDEKFLKHLDENIETAVARCEKSRRRKSPKK